MAAKSKAGKARLGSGLGRLVLGPRKVRIVCREGTVRVKRDAEFPPVEIELAAGERLVGFAAESTEQPLIDQLRGKKPRKTVDWTWTAFIEQDPPQPKPRKARSTSNGRKSAKAKAKGSRKGRKG